MMSLVSFMPYITINSLRLDILYRKCIYIDILPEHATPFKHGTPVTRNPYCRRSNHIRSYRHALDGFQMSVNLLSLLSKHLISHNDSRNPYIFIGTGFYFNYG